MDENNYTHTLQSGSNQEIDPLITKEHAHSNWIPKMIEIPSVGKYQDDYHDEQFFLDLSNTQSSLSFDISNDEGFSDGIASQSVLDKLNKTSSSFTDWTDYYADFHGVNEQTNLTNMDESFSDSRKLSLNPREILNQVEHVNYDENVSDYGNAEYTASSANQDAGNLSINASDILNQVHNISADGRHSEMEIQQDNSDNGGNFDGLLNMDYDQEPLGINKVNNISADGRHSEREIQQDNSDNGANFDGLLILDYEQEPLGINQQANDSESQENTRENGGNLDAVADTQDGTNLDFLIDNNGEQNSQDIGDVQSNEPESTTVKVQVKKEKRSHLKKDPKDLAIGKNCKAKLDLALKAVEDGMKYRDAAEEIWCVHRND